jgi:hypothetical protein
VSFLRRTIEHGEILRAKEVLRVNISCAGVKSDQLRQPILVCPAELQEGRELDILVATFVGLSPSV